MLLDVQQIDNLNGWRIELLSCAPHYAGVEINSIPASATLMLVMRQCHYCE